MKIKPKRRRFLFPIIFLGVLLAVLLAVLVYIKLFGLKTALEELVATQTEEKYALHIGRAKVDLLHLSFEFDSLTVSRNPSEPETGIREVKIAKLELQVANLWGMFRTKKFDIRTLILDEPLIKIDNHQKRDTTQEKFHLGQQIVKLYPAVESLLERFKIEHLKINRAALGVKNHPKPPLNLSFIDFLIVEWNEGKMAENSQLHLMIGEQELALEKANFSFTAIEYDFNKRQLSLTNLEFSTVDSVSKSQVDVTAQMLIMNKLAYKDLFERQQLNYEKVTVLDPKVNLNLVLKHRDSTNQTQTNEKEVITRIIKQAVGECNIDTLVIQNADVETILKKGPDSTVIAIPQVNFTLYTFKVSNESETFITGEAQIELDKTSIALTDGITISCNRLFFDRQRNLTFEDVELFDAANNLTVVECRLLTLQEFHILPLLFERELGIQSISIEDAIINIPPENIFGSSNQGKKKGLNSISVPRISLKNVALHHKTSENNIYATGLSAVIENLTKKQNTDFDYDVREIDVADIRVDLFKKETSAHMQNVSFNGNLLKTAVAELKLKELDVVFENLRATHHGEIINLKHIGYKTWNSIEINKLAVSGKLPDQKTPPKSDTAKSKQRFSASSVTVKNLNAHLTRHDLDLSVSGKNLAISKAVFENSEISYSSIKGDLDQVNIATAELNVAASKLTLAIPEKIDVGEVVVKKENLHFKTGHSSFQKVTRKGARWTVDKAQIASFGFEKDSTDLLATDKILFRNIQFGGDAKPTLGFVEVFDPKIVLPKNASKKGSAKQKLNLEFLEQLGDFAINPGSLKLPNAQLLNFGRITGNAKKKQIVCAYLETHLPKMNFAAKHFSIDENQIKMDTFSIDPNLKWYAEHGLEASVITADLYKLNFSGYSLDNLLLESKFQNVDIVVGGFYLKAFRDKRLPDPPFVEKPATLAGLIELPKNVSVNNVTLENGKIDIVQISDVTGQKGTLNMDSVWANVTLNDQNPKALFVHLDGGGKLYGQGVIKMNYRTIDSDMFALKASAENFDLLLLNEILLPLEAVEIKSGYLEHYELEVTANNHQSIGNATITYDDLHLIMYKRNDPEKKTLGTELLTFVADGLVLKKRKENATTTVTQTRVKNRSTFNYWTKSATNGALKAVREGKKQKN